MVIQLQIKKWHFALELSSMILRMKGQFDETFGITSFAEVDFFCPSLAFETPLTLAPAQGSKYFVSIVCFDYTLYNPKKQHWA